MKWAGATGTTHLLVRTDGAASALRFERERGFYAEAVPISEQNVEIARRANDSFRRGDWDAIAASLDPHILIRADPGWPEQYIDGRDAVVRWQRDAWELLGPDLQIERVEDLGDRALIRLRWKTRAQHSGIEEGLRWTEIATYRNGRLIFSEMLLDHEQALDVLGMRE